MIKKTVLIVLGLIVGKPLLSQEPPELKRFLDSLSGELLEADQASQKKADEIKNLVKNSIEERGRERMENIRLRSPEDVNIKEGFLIAIQKNPTLLIIATLFCLGLSLLLLWPWLRRLWAFMFR